MAGPNPTLTDLAAKISEAAAIIDGYLTKNNLPKPSWDVNGPGGLPHVPEVQLSKLQMEAALLDISALLLAPAESLGVTILPAMHDHTVLNVLNQFNFWDAVPLNGSASYAEVASKVKIGEDTVRRVLRHAMLRHIFAATPDGTGVVHTSISAAAVKQPLLRSWIGHNLEEVAPATLNLPEVLREYGESPEPNETAGAWTFFKDDKDVKTAFEWYAKDGEGERRGWRARRFGEAMKCAMDEPAFDIKTHIHRMIDWSSLGEGPFVDIGGSVGHISFELASKYPQLKCVVQDLPDLEGSFKAARPAEVADRVSFQVHDFFTPEPVQHAAAYFLKHILHDWSDPYATKILKQIVPVMKPGVSRLLILESVVPPAGAAPPAIMRIMSGLDMQMMTMLNAKERMAEDWTALLKAADSRLILKGIHQPPGSAFAIIEASIEG